MLVLFSIGFCFVLFLYIFFHPLPKTLSNTNQQPTWKRKVWSFNMKFLLISGNSIFFLSPFNCAINWHLSGPVHAYTNTHILITNTYNTKGHTYSLVSFLFTHDFFWHFMIAMMVGWCVGVFEY